MKIKRYSPSPGLASLVRHFLVLKADDFTVNTLLPSDTLTLVMRLSGSISDLSRNTQEPVPSMALTGARNFPRSVAYAAGTEQECLRMIEDFVLSAISDVQPHPAVERALSLIHRSAGQLSVRRLVESLGTNKDSLEKHFRRELGFGPKAFMRISRMKEALALVGETESLSTLALQVGFSDQSHFNHEFRTMVGLTPQDFIRAPTRR